MMIFNSKVFFSICISIFVHIFFVMNFLNDEPKDQEIYVLNLSNYQPVQFEEQKSILKEIEKKPDKEKPLQKQKKVEKKTIKEHKQVIKDEKKLFIKPIEKLIEQQNIDPQNISLIKMDIEGGEKIVVPSLVNFLNTYKPVFYISLHRCFLTDTDINKIIDILFNIYDKCYDFNNNGEKILIDKDFIQSKKLTCIVFE